VMRNRQARLIPLIAGLACLGAAVPASGRAAEPWGFEQVSPVNKGGGAVTLTDTFQAAPDGDSLLYTATAPFDGAPGEASPQYVRYLGLRGPGAWTNRALDPPHEQGTAASPNVMSVVGSSVDLSHVLVASRRALTAGATEGGGNLYMRNTRTGAYRLVATSDDPRFARNFLTTQGSHGVTFVANDGGSALFATTIPLLEGVPTDEFGLSSVYAWTADGGLRLKSVSPDAEGGVPIPMGSNIGQSETGPRDALPVGDGLAHVYFSSSLVDNFGNVPGPVHVRSGEETRVVSVSRIPGDPADPVPSVVDAVGRDGRYLLFRTSGPDRLTPDTPTFGDPTHIRFLYRYDVFEDSLTYIAADSVDNNLRGNGPGLQMSKDGQSIAVQSTVAQGGAAVDGQQNFYVWREGSLRYVATLDMGSSGNSGTDFFRLLSQDGRYFAFTDNSVSLAAGFGKDIVSAKCPVAFIGTPGPCAQVYLYDFDADELACVSCRPDGAPPNGHAGDPINPLVGMGIIRMNAHQPRILAEDGTVFFGSADDLVAADGNGSNDVYAYKDGQLRLVSRGAQGASSRFLDATPDGKTVFFSTDDPIVGTDTDKSVDVYMTREGAGYPYTAPVVEPPCTGGDCRDPFAGAGGLAPIGSLTFAKPDEEPARSGRATVRVSMLRAAIGSRAVLRVKVPSAGSIRVSGRAVRNAGRRATRSATYRVEVRLSAKARKSLAKRKALSVRVRVAFRSRDGKTARRTVTVRFKAPTPAGRRAAAEGR
jgi:hypothetical protein